MTTILEICLCVVAGAFGGLLAYIFLVPNDDWDNGDDEHFG